MQGIEYGDDKGKANGEKGEGCRERGRIEIMEGECGLGMERRKDGSIE